MSNCDENSRKELMDYLSQNKITVMSTVGCPACVDAKNLLNKKEYKYSELDLTKEDNEKYFNCLMDITKSHYVPQVFINKKYIGGYRELQYLNQTGLLSDLYHS